MSGLGSFDFSQLEQLSARFKGAVDHNLADQFMHDFLFEMAYRAEGKIKMRTPVDTGDLRRRWKVGEVRKVGNAYVVEISNNLEYASYIENGHRTGKDLTRWVTGRFMATITMQEIERELPRYLEMRQVEFIERLLGGR